MAFIEIQTSQAAADLENKLKALYPPDAHRSISRAINHSIAKANTQANREVRSIFNIALKDMNDKNNKIVKNSSPDTLTGTINASQNPLSLSKFNPIWVRSNRHVLKRGKGFKMTGKAKKNSNEGVSVEIIKGKRVNIPSAFILFNKGGSPVMARGVYEGTSGFNFGKARLPINKLNTKSVFFALANDKVEKKMKDSINVFYPERLLHELTQGLKY